MMVLHGEAVFNKLVLTINLYPLILPRNIHLVLYPADCVPVWYNIGGDDLDTINFRNFYGESGGPPERTIETSSCLAFECPACRDKNNHEFFYTSFAHCLTMQLRFILVCHLHFAPLSPYRDYEWNVHLAPCCCQTWTHWVNGYLALEQCVTTQQWKEFDHASRKQEHAFSGAKWNS
jgi:hypothetical protein